MPCWKRRLERCALLLGCLLCIGLARAGSIVAESADLAPDGQGLALTARFGIDLGPRLEEAVGRGVALSFRFEFDLKRKRRYWVDEHITGRVLEYRLGYHALTRQYRLSLGTLHQNFATLHEALQALARVVRLHVVDQDVVVAGETYLAAVRLSLDHNQLPKPLQVDAIADSDWRVEAKTLRWEFKPATLQPLPPGRAD